MNSMETGQTNEFEDAFSDKAIRQGFIKKVYSIVAVQLLVTFIPCLVFSVSKEAGQFAERNWWLFIVGAIGTIILIFPMVCSKTLRTKVPINYILLGLFTLCETIMFAFIGALSDPKIISVAMFITCFIVVGLTIFAFQTKIDFTVCSSLLFCILLCLLLSGLSLAIYRPLFNDDNLVNVVYSSIMALILSLIIVIDTQMLAGGGRYAISTEEYVFGALVIYLDILRLFIEILQIVGAASK